MFFENSHFIRIVFVKTSAVNALNYDNIINSYVVIMYNIDIKGDTDD
ncbi:MAG: Unknown protein [uncultured Sulfurovum sp.]|uniref:Uncharacterized protein n=1 Tax=uncultured Sulfurovum sp. TaxID=269237 RepID=A0A6S6SVI9_9BACT|nr:MAG: Unknown protein [uncultured Sulfurovum sp.]